jgi:uncharacterized membrane protein (DUF485 family)
MRPDLQIYRYALINLIAFALLGIAALKGWVAKLLAADVTDLVIVMFAVFLVGLVVCSEKIVRTSRHIDRLKRTAPDQPAAP